MAKGQYVPGDAHVACPWGDVVGMRRGIWGVVPNRDGPTWLGCEALTGNQDRICAVTCGVQRVLVWLACRGHGGCWSVGPSSAPGVELDL